MNIALAPQKAGAYGFDYPTIEIHVTGDHPSPLWSEVSEAVRSNYPQLDVPRVPARYYPGGVVGEGGSPDRYLDIWVVPHYGPARILDTLTGPEHDIRSGSLDRRTA